MAQQKGFGSGFVIGSIVGSVVGGLLGTVLASRSDKISGRNSESLQNSREIGLNSEESIELARHGLEEKIAQLNLAIDDVTQQLGSVKTNEE